MDIALDPAEAEKAIALWTETAEALLEAVGWTGEATTSWVYPGGVSLALSAPLDALYAATEVNEAAWEATEPKLDGGEPPDLGPVIERLREVIRKELNPRLMEIRAAAQHRQIAFLSDDDLASVGLGTGSRTWPVDRLPAVEEVPWESLHDVPIALVTGTNGKTTTVRLLAAIAAAAGRTPGVSSTDWIKVGDDLLDAGDWSGPGGARTILRDQRVEIAVLETARGGMLRRGLAVTEADVAAILNVAEDHLGEWGVEDLAALVEGKYVVARAARHLVLNADDPHVVERSRNVDRPITWFGLDPQAPALASALEAGHAVVVLIDRALCRQQGTRRDEIIELADVPSALGGAARHNVANALAAIAVAHRLALPDDAIREGLASFRSDAAENPGRLNRFELGGVRVLVDFAHNPHGLEALLAMAGALEADRRLVLIGQAGDRTDTSIRDLGRIVSQAKPERVIVKEMRKYLRGRDEGVIPEMIVQELERNGTPRHAIGRASSELEGMEQALEWARAGDLLLILTHESRDEVLRIMGDLEAGGWQPGDPIPSSAGD